MKILVKALDNERKDSFWYSGQVAYIDTDHGRYSLEAVGDIRVMFKANDCWYKKDGDAVEKALELNLFDCDLRELSEHDGWGNNNWFEVVFIKDGKTKTSGTDDVCYDYDEALEQLKICVEEEIYKT
jgi:hypothetical protein